MNLNVQLFAAARDSAGRSTVGVVLPEAAAVADLRRILVDRFPALKPLQDTLLIAVNREYADNELKLRAGDEVACFPPVSGG